MAEKARILEACIVHLWQRPDGDVHVYAAITAKIKALGAKASPRLTKDVTHVIYGRKLHATAKERYAEDEDLRLIYKKIAETVHVVSPLWLHYSEDGGSRAKESLYLERRPKEPLFLVLSPLKSGSKRRRKSIAPRPRDQVDIADLDDAIFSSSQQIRELDAPPLPGTNLPSGEARARLEDTATNAAQGGQQPVGPVLLAAGPSGANAGKQPAVEADKRPAPSESRPAQRPLRQLALSFAILPKKPQQQPPPEQGNKPVLAERQPSVGRQPAERVKGVRFCEPASVAGASGALEVQVATAAELGPDRTVEAGKAPAQPLPARLPPRCAPEGRLAAAQEPPAPQPQQPATSSRYPALPFAAGADNGRMLDPVRRRASMAVVDVEDVPQGAIEQLPPGLRSAPPKRRMSSARELEQAAGAEPCPQLQPAAAALASRYPALPCSAVNAAPSGAGPSAGAIQAGPSRPAATAASIVHAPSRVDLDAAAQASSRPPARRRTSAVAEAMQAAGSGTGARGDAAGAIAVAAAPGTATQAARPGGRSNSAKRRTSRKSAGGTPLGAGLPKNLNFLTPGGGTPKGLTPASLVAPRLKLPPGSGSNTPAAGATPEPAGDAPAGDQAQQAPTGAAQRRPVPDTPGTDIIAAKLVAAVAPPTSVRRCARLRGQLPPTPPPLGVLGTAADAPALSPAPLSLQATGADAGPENAGGSTPRLGALLLAPGGQVGANTGAPTPRLRRSAAAVAGVGASAVPCGQAAESTQAATFAAADAPCPPTAGPKSQRKGRRALPLQLSPVAAPEAAPDPDATAAAAGPTPLRRSTRLVSCSPLPLAVVGNHRKPPAEPFVVQAQAAQASAGSFQGFLPLPQPTASIKQHDQQQPSPRPEKRRRTDTCGADNQQQQQSAAPGVNPATERKSRNCQRGAPEEPRNTCGEPLEPIIVDDSDDDVAIIYPTPAPRTRGQARAAATPKPTEAGAPGVVSRGNAVAAAEGCGVNPRAGPFAKQAGGQQQEPGHGSPNARREPPATDQGPRTRRRTQAGTTPAPILVAQQEPTPAQCPSAAQQPQAPDAALAAHESGTPLTVSKYRTRQASAQPPEQGASARVDADACVPETATAAQGDRVGTGQARGVVDAAAPATAAGAGRAAPSGSCQGPCSATRSRRRALESELDSAAARTPASVAKSCGRRGGSRTADRAADSAADDGDPVRTAPDAAPLAVEKDNSGRTRRSGAATPTRTTPMTTRKRKALETVVEETVTELAADVPQVCTVGGAKGERGSPAKSTPAQRRSVQAARKRATPAARIVDARATTGGRATRPPDNASVRKDNTAPLAGSDKSQRALAAGCPGPGMSQAHDQARAGGAADVAAGARAGCAANTAAASAPAASTSTAAAAAADPSGAAFPPLGRSVMRNSRLRLQKQAALEAAGSPRASMRAPAKIASELVAPGVQPVTGLQDTERQGPVVPRQQSEAPAADGGIASRQDHPATSRPTTSTSFFAGAAAKRRRIGDSTTASGHTATAVTGMQAKDDGTSAAAHPQDVNGSSTAAAAVEAIAVVALSSAADKQATSLAPSEALGGGLNAASGGLAMAGTVDVGDTKASQAAPQQQGPPAAAAATAAAKPGAAGGGPKPPTAAAPTGSKPSSSRATGAGGSKQANRAAAGFLKITSFLVASMTRSLTSNTSLASVGAGGGPTSSAAQTGAAAGPQAPALGQYPRGKEHPLRLGVKYLAHTCVDGTVSAVIQNAIKQLGGARLCTPGYEDGHMTHLVLGAAQRRTVKVLLGIANGSLFLTPAWVTDSLAAGRWLPEEEYMAEGAFSATALAVRAQLQEAQQSQQQQQQQQLQHRAGTSTVPGGSLRAGLSRSLGPAASAGSAASGAPPPAAQGGAAGAVAARPLTGRMVAVHNAQCNGPRLAEVQARKADVEKLIVALGGRVVPVRSAGLLVVVGGAACAAERRPRVGNGVCGPTVQVAGEEWLMRLAETHVWQEPPQTG